MSVSYLETRNAYAGHEVLRSGVVICYRNGRRFGRAVQQGLSHVCPVCREQVFTFAS